MKGPCGFEISVLVPLRGDNYESFVVAFKVQDSHEQALQDDKLILADKA